MSVLFEQYQACQAQIKKLRSEVLEFSQKIAKLEGQVKILNIKSSAYEKQLAKKVSQNKELIALLQKQQNQKLSLLSKDRQLSYTQSRGEIEARRNEALVKSLTQQLQKLKAQIANSATQKIRWMSQKQQMSNKILIIEEKHKATKNMEQVIALLKNSLEATSKQNDQLKTQVEELKKKFNSGNPFQKTVISNNSQVIDGLVKDFEQKLSEKQRMMAQLRDNYQKKIAQLNHTLDKNQKYI